MPGKRWHVRIERMADDIVDEWQTFRDVFCCPVTEVKVQQTLVSTYDSYIKQPFKLHQFHSELQHTDVTTMM